MVNNEGFLELFGSQLESYGHKNQDFPNNFKIVYRLLGNELQVPADTLLNMAESVWKDLGIFDSGGLYHKIQRCRTYFGMVVLFQCLAQPVREKPIWIDSVRQLLEKPEVLNKLRCSLDQVRKHQTDVIWFWKKRSKEEQETLSTAFYTHKYLLQLNRNRLATYLYFAYRIFLQPIYTIFSPAMCLILPIVILRYKLGIKIPISVYCRLLRQVIPASFGVMPNGFPQTKEMLWVYASSILSTLLYVQSVYTCIDGAFKLHRLAGEMQTRIRSLKHLCETVNQFGFLVNAPQQSCFQKLWYLEDTDDCSRPSYLWKHWCFTESGKDICQTFLATIGRLDCLLSILEYYQNCRSGSYAICFPTFVTTKPSQVASQAFLRIQDVWHPYLYGQKVIYNSCQLGSDNNQTQSLKNHLMITGPNAGGKSTLLKSICLNILMAQTIGLCTATQYQANRFDSFYTHLRVPDIEGEASLFQEEINRSAVLLKNIKNGVFFAAFDELFSSTSIEEGMSCAYSLCKEVGSRSNGISVVATHYQILTKIPDYMNCEMYAYRSPQGNPVFTYQLKRGISKQRFALDLLQLNIDTSVVVERAKKTLVRLLADG